MPDFEYVCFDSHTGRQYVRLSGSVSVPHKEESDLKITQAQDDRIMVQVIPGGIHRA
jgi:hypothetical protein